jgi:small subunit ribosomal protein S13
MIIFFGIPFLKSMSVGEALLSIAGIGLPYARFLCSFFGLSFHIPLEAIPREQLKLMVRKSSTERVVLLVLKRDSFNAVKRKIQLKTYKGIRHLEGLPVRGQNTKSNASTSRKLKAKRVFV